jgi:hypothetical protein
MTNQPPSISPIPSQNARACTPAFVPFSVWDPDTNPDNLLLSATASNTNLVGSTNFVFSGNGTNRVLTIYPLPGFGTTVVSIIVSDGQATATTSFILRVGSSLAPPSFSAIPDQIGYENSLLSLNLTADLSGPCGTEVLAWFAASDNPTLFPATNISFLPDGHSATLVLTPASNQIGHARITVTTSDGTAAASQSFNATVTPKFVGRLERSSATNLKLTFSGLHASNLILEASPDLKQWSPLATNNFAKVLEFTPPLTPQIPIRFFRVNISGKISPLMPAF